MIVIVTIIGTSITLYNYHFFLVIKAFEMIFLKIPLAFSAFAFPKPHSGTGSTGQGLPLLSPNHGNQSVKAS